MTRCWFTPASAREVLKRVRPAVECLCRVYGDMERSRPSRIGSDQRVDPLYFLLVSRLHLALAELARLGVRIKDLKRGLVDFPARREGREVALSWRVGEPSVAFWHELDGGFDGRRPLDEDGPWDEPSV